MRTFLILVGAIAILGSALALYLLLSGSMPVAASAAPPGWESRLARRIADVSVERQAPRRSNPIPRTEKELLAGLKLYRTAARAGTATAAGLRRGARSSIHRFHSSVPGRPASRTGRSSGSPRTAFGTRGWAAGKARCRKPTSGASPPSCPASIRSRPPSPPRGDPRPRNSRGPSREAICFFGIDFRTGPGRWWWRVHRIPMA
jgi:hypothetical protein